MKVIGLTGRSGSGKGEVCKLFAAYGISSIDTDVIARELMRSGSVCFKEVVRYFSDVILDVHGEIDRRKLAEIVFADKAKLEALNKLTHGHITEECRDRIDDMRDSGANAVIIDAPLLFESKFAGRCDVIIAVIADAGMRIERLMSRDNISLEQVIRRLESQKDDDFFIRNCTFAIYNNGSVRDMERQVADIYTNMLKYDLI